MKRKLISVTLSAAMVAGLIAGCGSSETATTTQADTSAATTTTTDTATDATAESTESAYQLDKITVVVDGTFNADLDAGQEEWEQAWEDAVGIEIEIKQQDHSSYTDAIGRLFASGDYPDVILLNASQYAEYAKTGLLWDMTEAYDNADFNSRIATPEVNLNQRIDGKQYGIATGLGGGCITYVKKAWLDAVGMNAEDITDFDSYYAMLKAFTEQDPDGNGLNDTYGVAAAGFLGSEAPYTNYLPEFYQDAYPGFIQDDNGVWYDGFDTDSMKAALVRLQTAYADGVIDPETLTASTKIVREKWWSTDQAGSFGAFTYWAGYWNDNLVTNMANNGIDSELVRLTPIAELGGYINRESPVYCIIDDGDGNNDREQAIFDAFFETMFDGDVVETLWVYGVEGIHWSTAAETFSVGKDDNVTEYTYEEGEFHLLPNPKDPTALWKKNAIDPSTVIVKLTNGFESATDLTNECNAFFAKYSVNAPASASCDGITEYGGTLSDLRNTVISEVVVKGNDIDEWMTYYEEQSMSMVEEILSELNAQ